MELEKPMAAGDIPESGGNPATLRSAKRSLPILLLRAREAMMTRFRPILAAQDVTEQQWRVLRVLAEESGLDASDVAQRAAILAPSLSRIIISLERRGLILRARDRIDGRRVRLSITGKGRAIIAAVSPHSEAIYADLEARYGVARLESLLSLLDELIDAARSTPR